MARRSRKGSATRQEILAAASVVFARRGSGGTRLEDIATEAGTSRTGVYHYFPSRLAIFVEIGRVAILASRRVIDVGAKHQSRSIMPVTTMPSWTGSMSPRAAPARPMTRGSAAHPAFDLEALLRHRSRGAVTPP